MAPAITGGAVAILLAASALNTAGQAIQPGSGFNFGNSVCQPNTVVAGPASGSFTAAVTCRGLVMADLPALSFSLFSGQIGLSQIPATINANTTGTAAIAAAALGLSVVVAAVSNLPATCSVGQIGYVVTSSPGVYVCSATDTWTLESGSGGGGGGGGTTVPVFSSAEVPSGAVNGSNNTFALAYTPNPTSSLALYVNGLVMQQGTDYTLSGSTVLFVTASIPQTGDIVQAWYQAGWSGTLPATCSPNQVAAGPASGSTAEPPACRALVAADLPSSFNAPTATALAATPTTCSSGEAPTGVDAQGNAQGCQAVGGGGSSVLPYSQGYTGAISETGSAVTLYSVSGVSLASGACLAVDVQWYGATGGPVTETLVVDSTVVATLRPNTYSVSSGYFTQSYRYCNNTASTTAQTLFVTNAAYCSSDCTTTAASWTYTYALDEGMLPAVTNFDWTTGTHTVAIQTTATSSGGSIYGYAFSVR